MTRAAASPDEETFGEMVRKLRDRLPGRVSQAKLGELAGVSERTIQNIESGESADPAPSTVRGIATALRLPVSTLSRKLGWVPIEETDTKWLFSGLDEEDQRMVLEMVERLRKRPPAAARSRKEA